MPMLNPNLKGFYETDARNYVLLGGRASGKTYHTAAFCVWLAANYKVKFLCTRQFQSRIEDSVKSVIEVCIAAANLQNQFIITNDYIQHKKTGSLFRFLGIRRNIEEIKGFTGVDVLWIEEAESLTDDQWTKISPTVRDEGSRIFVVFNPHYDRDFVYQHFVINPPPKTIIRKINYDENPYLSKTMLDEIAIAKERDYEQYLHIYEGVPLSDNENAVIKRSWLLAAIDAHKTLGIQITGSRRIGFDVADAGEDKCAQVQAHGSLTEWADEWKAGEDELLTSCTRVWARARDVSAKVVYDAIGVGAMSGSKFNELNNGTNLVEHDKFFAGGAVMKPDAKYADTGIANKDFFANIKAQAWWLVADRLKNTYNAVKNGQKFADDEMIFLSSEMPYLDKLIDELTQPRRDYDNAGRVKVESKKDMAKDNREGGAVKSPNLADAFIMAHLPQEMKKRSFFG